MRILFITGSLLGILWLVSWKRPEKTWPYTNNAPGIVWITDDLGMDRTDVTNFNWLEFLYWTSRTYGKNSEAYKAILPDTSLWLNLDGRYHEFESDYLRSPRFRDFPVLGLTYEQMIAYCKWRSDRVFEYFLIKNDQLEWRPTRDPDSIITIEKFLAGKLPQIRKPQSIVRFPDYDLPNKNEWILAEKHNEQVLKKISPKNKERLNTANRSPFDFPFPAKVIPDLKGKQQTQLYFLHSNVKKQLAEKAWTAGKAWLQRVDLAPEEDFDQQSDSTSLSRGFRCSFRWIAREY